MHEFSICRALINEVKTVALQHDSQRVLSIVLQVGPLSGVVPELLERAYTVARAGTVAADANLVIESLPVRVFCTECDVKTTVDSNRLLCGQCGGWRTTVVSGDELLLAHVEIEGTTVH